MFNQRPLGVGGVGFVRGDFRRLTGAAAKISRKAKRPLQFHTLFSTHASQSNPAQPQLNFHTDS